MKMIFKIAVVVLTGGLCLGNFNARADLEIGAAVKIHARTDFEGPLAARGSWVDMGSRGRCWRPAGIAAGWRPYGQGHWVWTDAGWYWDSDEPWAWACYHYGTWYNDPSGWVWVPGTQWAPAWVQWRTGGGYVGWAPCAPAGVVIAPASFGFVSVGHFSDRLRPEGLIINNPGIMRKTKLMAAAKRESRTVGGTKRGVVFNHGPSVAMIQKSTGKKITSVPIEKAARRTTATASASIHPRSPAAGRKPAEAPASRSAVPERRAEPGSAPEAAKPNPRETHPENAAPKERGTPERQTPAKVVPNTPTPAHPAKPPEQPPKPSEKDKP